MRAPVLSLLLLAGLAPALVAKPTERLHAYAPPVIPHAIDKDAACTDCHGRERAGGVPAVPHRVGGWCQSCHVPSGGAAPFRANPFKGEPVSHARGARAYPGAPPALPHPVAMRENCAACHGRETHPGMRRNPHPGRPNCLSCHLEIR